MRCCEWSEAMGESLGATATIAPRLLLVAARSPWPRTLALHPALLEISAEIKSLQQLTRARLVLFEPRGCDGAQPYADLILQGPDVYLDADRATSESIHELRASFEGGVPSVHTAERSRAPRWLICTHRSHDPCCGDRGEQLLGKFEDAAACTHLGGDRFAANVLCSRSGDMYGRVDVQSADIISSLSGGLVFVPGYRGNVFTPEAVQVAQREVLAMASDLVAPRPTARTYQVGEREALVEVEHLGQRYEVSLQWSTHSPQDVTTDCGLLHLTGPRWQTVSIGTLP